MTIGIYLRAHGPITIIDLGLGAGAFGGISCLIGLSTLHKAGFRRLVAHAILTTFAIIMNAMLAVLLYHFIPESMFTSALEQTLIDIMLGLSCALCITQFITITVGCSLSCYILGEFCLSRLHILQSTILNSVPRLIF